LAFPPRVARVEAGFPNDLPGPKISPDSKLYFLKIWWEKLVLFFTFDAESRAERYKIFAEKRAAEVKEMIVKGKPAIAEKLKTVYQTYLNKAKDALNKAIQKAIDKQKENLKQQLEKKLDDIMQKIKDSLSI
jgi:DNA-binding transcriptional regulator YbjK